MNMSILAPAGRWGIVSLAVSLAVAGGATTSLALDRNDNLPSGVAFRLGGHDVTVKALNQRIDTLSALYSLKKPTSKKKLDTFRRDAAKSMAVSMILANEAKKEGIAISRDDAQAGLDNVIQQTLGGDDSAFTTFLGDNGISEDDVIAEVSRTLATSKLYSKVTADVKAPTEEEAQKDYNAHRADMVSPEQRTLSNIVVSSKSEAAQILNSLRSGASFTALAKANSLDSSTNEKGGSLGTHAAQDMDATYAKAAFAAKNHAFYGPVQTAENVWNVGYVNAVIPSAPLSFADVKTTLIAALKSRKQLAVWDRWLARVIKAAEVRYADAYLPAHPNAAPSTDPETSQP